MRHLVLCGTAALLAGCLPVPVRHVDSPPLVGTVKHAGAAVAGAQVCVMGRDPDDRTCGPTDAQGQFSLPARRSTSAMLLMGDRLVDYRVEITTAAGESFIGYQRGSIGSPARADRSMLKPLQLECDLSTPSAKHDGDAAAMPGRPICTSSTTQTSDHHAQD